MLAPVSAWLEKRCEGITGSDAAAILGIDPYRTAIEVWAEKVGALRARDLSKIERVKWGSMLEGAVIREFLAVTGRERVRAQSWPEIFPAAEILPLEHAWEQFGKVRTRTKYITASRKVERAMTTPDLALRAWTLLPTDDEQVEREGPGIGEIKTTSAYNARAWSEGVPLRVQVQIQMELLVAGGPTWGTAVVLIGGQAMRMCDVAAHGPFMRLLEDTIGTFWDKHVRTGIPPEPLGTEAERVALSEIYPTDDGATVVLEPRFAEHATKARALREQATRIDDEIVMHETKIKAAIRGASYAAIQDSRLCYSFKADARGARRLHPMKDGALIALPRPAPTREPTKEIA